MSELITLNGFADDHSIRKSFKPSVSDAEADVINQLQIVLGGISNWMDNMRFKLNQDKTEFINFGYRAQVQKCT